LSFFIYFQEGCKAANVSSESFDDVIALVGFTGSGKSTASKFLLKDPSLKIKTNNQVWILQSYYLYALPLVKVTKLGQIRNLLFERVSSERGE
jgi:ABC-type dipeptide/oligopeptide/nickel transport system ATPase component